MIGELAEGGRLDMVFFMIGGRGGSPAWIDTSDLGPLQSEACHQAALVEDEGEGTSIEIGGIHGSRHPAIRDYQTWAATDVPATTAVHILDGTIIHQEERVTEVLDASLQAPRSRSRLEKPADAAVRTEQGAVSCLATEDEACPSD